MKEIVKKIILLLLVFSMLVVLLPVIGVEAKSLSDLQYEYSTGSKFNTAFVYSYQVGNRVTTINAKECAGFAAKMYYEYYGVYPEQYADETTGKLTDLNQAQPGDIIRYNGHSVWVLERNGNDFKVAEANYDGQNTIRWYQYKSYGEFCNNFSFVMKAPYVLGTDTGTLYPPSNIKATTQNQNESIASSSVKISWSKANCSTGYLVKIYKATDVENSNYSNAVKSVSIIGNYKTNTEIDKLPTGDYYAFVHTTRGGKYSSTGGTPSKFSIKPITKIVVKEETAGDLIVGETKKYIAKITPEDTSDSSKLTWSSSNEDIAVVDNNGIVKGKSAGSVTITAKAINGKNGYISVKVKPKIMVTGIDFDKTNLDLYKGDAEQITAIVKPNNAFNKSIEWVSSNNSVVTVKDGLVTAVGEGTAIITAKATDQSNVYKECTVKVENEKYDPNESMSLNHKTYQLNSIGENVELKALLKSGKETQVTWTSQNPEIISVDSNGKVIAKRGGFAYIYADSKFYGKQTCWIYVNCPVELSDGEKAYVGDLDGNGVFDSNDSASILEIFKCENMTKDNKLLGDINGDGYVDADDASLVLEIFKLETFKIGNLATIRKVSISDNDISLIVGNSKKIYANVIASNTQQDKSIEWSSDNTNVATIDKNGNITAKGVGETVITAKSINGKIANCKVTVIEKKIIPGDIDGDGKTNGKDWNRIYEHINETHILNEEKSKYADINGDGKVNGKDWNRIYEHINETNMLY